MYKIIDGHKYDTDTAKEQALWEPNPYRSDFSWFRETLYRTKTGLYFIHGDGNAASRYARSCGQNEWCGGEAIHPLTEDAAKAWTEEHCDGDTYERIFGDPDDGPIRRLHINLSRRDADRLEEIKRRTGRTYTELISGWIWSQEV